MVATKEDWFEVLLDKYMPKIKAAIKVEIQLGNTLAIRQAIKQGSKTNRTPLNINKRDFEAFVDRVEMYVKGANRDLSKKINNSVLNNIAQRGSNQDLANDLKKIFNKNSPNYFDYKNRFKTIARTESTNILSTTSFNTANKMGATKKWLLGVNDNRQGEDSKIALRKYGSPDKAIPIDKPFTFTEGKKTYNYLLPPNRPNDREIVMYEFD